MACRAVRVGQRLVEPWAGLKLGILLAGRQRRPRSRRGAMKVSANRSAVGRPSEPWFPLWWNPRHSAAPPCSVTSKAKFMASSGWGAVDRETNLVCLPAFDYA
eukprot:9494339-Pyramimonas_sp.AAC.1